MPKLVLDEPVKKVRLVLDEPEQSKTNLIPDDSDTIRAFDEAENIVTSANHGETLEQHEQQQEQLQYEKDVAEHPMNKVFQEAEKRAISDDTGYTPGAIETGLANYSKTVTDFFTKPFGVEQQTYTEKELERGKKEHPVASGIGELSGSMVPYLAAAPLFPQSLLGVAGTFATVAGVNEVGRQKTEDSLLTPPSEKILNLSKEVGKAVVTAPIWHYANKLKFIGKPVASALARAGVKGAGTATLSKFFGNDLESSLKEGGMITALSLMFEVPGLTKTALGRGIIKQANRIAKEKGLGEGKFEINIDEFDQNIQRNSIFNLVKKLTGLMGKKGQNLKTPALPEKPTTPGGSVDTSTKPDTPKTPLTTNIPEPPAENYDLTDKGKFPVTRVAKTEPKDIAVLTEEEYLAQNGAGRQGFGEPALHKNIPEGKAKQDLLKRMSEKDKVLMEKRDQLRKEYQGKIKSGEIRQPTRIEKLLNTASGMSEREDVQAARRLLEKQGIDWRTRKEFEQKTESPVQSRPLQDISQEAFNLKKENFKEGDYVTTPDEVNALVEDTFKDAVSEENAPIYYVFGPTGSGKTTHINFIKEEKKYVVNDPDDFKVKMGSALNENADKYHESSSIASNAAFEYGFENNYPFVNSITGRNTEKFKKLIERQKQVGRPVKSTYVYVEEDESVRRAEKRHKEKDGINIPEEATRSNHQGGLKTLVEVFMPLSDRLLIMANPYNPEGKSGHKPVADFKDGKIVELHDKKLLTKILKNYYDIINEEVTDEEIGRQIEDLRRDIRVTERTSRQRDGEVDGQGEQEQEVSEEGKTTEPIKTPDGITDLSPVLREFRKNLFQDLPFNERQKIENEDTRKLANYWGFENLKVEENGWLEKPEFKEEKIKLLSKEKYSMNTIRLGESPNKKWTYSLSLNTSTAGTSSPITIWENLQFDTREGALRFAIKEFKERMNDYHFRSSATKKDNADGKAILRKLDEIESKLPKPKKTDPNKPQAREMVSQPTDTVKPIPLEPQSKIHAKSRQEIMNFLSEKLNVPIRRGLFRGSGGHKTLGIYKPDVDVIRIKEGGMGTVAHEIGHFLDDNFSQLHQMIIGDFSEELAPLDYDPIKMRSNEGFSEYLRLYITDPATAEQLAPNFDIAFKGWLENNPDIKTVVNQAQEDYQRWLKMPSVAKVMSQISFEEKSSGVDLKAGIDKFYNAVFEDIAPIKRFVDLAKKQGIDVTDEENPYIMARLFKGWVGKANEFLEHKTFDIKGKINGKGLKEILEPVKGVLDEFSAYLIARRVPELADREIATGIEKQDAIQTVKDLEKIYPIFKNIAKEIYTFQDNVLDYVKESGLIDSKMIKKIRSLNQNYVPFFRVIEDLITQGGSGKGFANVKNPSKRIKGSEREIVNPLESIIRNTYAMINAAERNVVGRLITKLANQDVELGRLVERIPQGMAKVATVDIFSELENKLRENYPDTAEEMTKLLESTGISQFVDVFRPSFLNKNNTLTVMNGGKKQTYWVDGELYKALMGLEQEEISTLIKVMSVPASWLRAGATTLSPEFGVRNIARDQFSAFVYSKFGYFPLIDVPRGLFSLLRKDSMYHEWKRSGGTQSMLVSMDRDYHKRRLNELFHQEWKKAINPINWLRVIGEWGEAATRLGEYKKGRRKGASMVSSAYGSREVTLDFMRKGHSIKSLNMIVAFINANLQDIDKMRRKFKESPGTTFSKAMIGLTLPSILLYMINRDDDRYKELPQWQKDFFWIIPTDKFLIRIPKPFLLGLVFASVPERILSHIDKKDPKAFDGLVTTLLEGMALSPTTYIPTSIKPLIENATNYSFFRKGPVEQIKLQRLQPEDRYTEFTTETAKRLGRLMGYSPVKIENLVRGWTGGAGMLALNMLDYVALGKERKLPLTPETMPMVRGFVAREPIGSASRSVNEFYENYERLTQVYTSIRKRDRKDLKEDNPEYKLYHIFTKYAKRISHYRAEINKALENTSLTPDQRLEQIKSWSRKMTETAQKANKKVLEKQKK